MPVPFLEASQAYYKQSSSEKNPKSVEELTVDLHEAILSLDVEATERLVSDGANPNLPVEDCAYKDNTDEQVVFKKRLKNIQRASSENVRFKSIFDPEKNLKLKLNAVNLALHMRFLIDCALMRKRNSREDNDINMERNEIISQLVDFLIHHDETILEKVDDDDSVASPIDIVTTFDARHQAVFYSNYRNYDFNSMTDILREIKSINEKKNADNKQAMSRWAILLEDTRFADVTFQCPDGEVLAHKCVLVANVEYFGTAFSQSWKESSSGVWKTDKPREVVEALIKYIYKGVVPNRALDKHSLQLLLMACEYQMKKLQTVCTDWLVAHLSILNVCDVLHCAHLHNFKNVKEACFDFLKNNAIVALGKQHIIRFGVDHPELWEEVSNAMQSSPTPSSLSSSSKKRKRASL